MIACETEFHVNSRFWRLVLNSAKTDALTALYMSPRRSLMQDYKRLWPSEIPICDAVMRGVVSYGLLPEGFEIIDGTITTSAGNTVAHTYGLNPWDGHIFDPTSAQFYYPDVEVPGGAVYRMMECNPGKVVVDPTIGLGILFAIYNEVGGLAYDLC